jgi:hypothetical protein
LVPPTAAQVKIKLSKSMEAIRREADNIATLKRLGGRRAQRTIVEVYDFFENYDR